MRLAASILGAAVLALAGCAELAQPGGAVASASSWVGVWGAPPAPPSASGSKAFDNQTVRQRLRLSAAGERVRVRFTNEYSDKPLTIGAAAIAVFGAAPIVVTFGGSGTATLPRGAPLLSDPISLPVKALDEVEISIYLPQPTGPCTCHALAVQSVAISGPGDFTKSASFEVKETMMARPFVSGVEVEAKGSLRAIIAFGDSITDGYQSTIGANRRWPDVLASRLNAIRQDRAVVNEAISGNRLMGYANAAFGDPALSRFDRDVLGVPGARWLVLLEGVNDLGMGGEAPPSFEAMIGAYRQIIARAHAHGLIVYGGTILPYKGARYYNEAGEKVRAAVNVWIRTGKDFDGVVDFDAVMRDTADPKRMKAELQSGDWLHPNDAGYKTMGEAVDLNLFR